MDSGFGIAGHSKSVQELTTSKLDYWSPLVVENGVKKSYTIEIRPQSIATDGPIDFHLAADPEKFIDIASLTLHGKVGIRYKDKTGGWQTVTNLNKCGVINNVYHSLFSCVTVKVNDCEIGDIANNSYPYTSYLQTLLGTSSSQAANHILQQRGFIKDSPQELKSLANPSITKPVTSAFQQRRKAFLSNDFLDFNIPLHNDLMSVEKYLPPNTKLTFTLRRSPDDFVLWKTETEATEYKIVLEDLHMKVKFLEVYPDVMKNHQKLLKESAGLRIKYTQNILKTFAVPAGAVELKQHNLFFGNRLPDRVYLAFVEQESYNGNISKNPFNFETAGMSEASLIVNGMSEPSPPYCYEPNVNERDLYFNFLENTGTASFELDSVNVTFEDFKGGYFIVPFDRSPTKDNGLYTHKSEGGNMTINVKCRTPIQKNFMVLVFASYESALLFIDDKVITQALY